MSYTRAFLLEKESVSSPSFSAIALSLINSPLTPTLSPGEREIVASGGAAFALAVVSCGDSFDSSGSVAATDPSASDCLRSG